MSLRGVTVVCLHTPVESEKQQAQEDGEEIMLLGTFVLRVSFFVAVCVL